jgi:hypothetical protein
MATPRSIAPPAAQSSSTSMAPAALHTPASLAARHGVAERTTILGFLLGLNDAAAIALAEGIAPSRVAADGTRLLGDASDFLATATESQRALLTPPISDEFMSSAATCVATTDTLCNRLARRKAKRSTAQKIGADEVERALTDARARRKLFQKKLVAMTGGDATWKKRINGACGAATTLGAMADSIDAMVSEGRSLAKHASAKGSRAVVPAATFTAMTEYAETLRATSKKTEGVASKVGTAKGELAWWSGAGVWFLQTLVEVFNAAHEVDPVIPSLAFVSLRSALAPQSAAAKRRAAKKTAKPTG